MENADVEIVYRKITASICRCYESAQCTSIADFYKGQINGLFYALSTLANYSGIKGMYAEVKVMWD